MIASADARRTLHSVAGHGLPGAQAHWPSEPCDDTTWRELTTTVAEQRMEGLLVAAIADGALPVTAQQDELAREMHVERMCSVLLLEAELLDLNALLTHAGVDVRVLKGSAVAHLDYPDPALRCFGDVDLLVRGEQFDDAVAVLAGTGLQRRYPQPRPGFDARFSKGTSFATPQGVELDLHRTFVMGPYGLTIDLKEVWRNSSPLTIGGATLQALDPEIRFLHACYHSALGDKSPRLVPQRDLVQMLLFGELDLERTRELMTSWAARPVVARAVSLAWERLAVADVVALSAWANRFTFDERAQRNLAAYLDDDADYASKSLAALHAVPGFRGKIAFARALAFPDAEYLQGRTRGLARLALALNRRRRA